MCRREAPGVEQFARQHTAEIRIVGLGGKDTVEEARDFVDTYETTSFQMLYDPSFESWEQLGVFGQPTAILFDRSGIARQLWSGPFDEQEVLGAAAALS